MGRAVGGWPDGRAGISLVWSQNLSRIDQVNDAQLADGGVVERRIAVRPDRRDELLAAVEIVETARDAILRAVLLQSSNQHRGDHEVHVEILHRSQNHKITAIPIVKGGGEGETIGKPIAESE